MRTQKRPCGFHLTPWLLLFPCLAVYLAFSVFPVLRTITISLQRYHADSPFPPSWIGLKNYATLLADPEVWRCVRTSAAYTAMIVPSVLILSALAAIALSRLRRLAKWLRVWILMPMVIAWPINGAIWYSIYDGNRGLLNWLLADLGVARLPQWMGIELALPCVAAAHVWGAIAFGTLLFTVALDAIPDTLYEAAAVDGAGVFRQLFHITLPGMSKTAGVVGVLVMLGAMRDFQYPFVMTKGGPAGVTETFTFHVYRTAFVDTPHDLGYAAAMSVLYGILLLSISVVILRTTRKAALQ